jgi:hypothetical protein
MDVLGQGGAPLDREVERHFEQILILARRHFAPVEIVRQEVSEQRAILKFRARRGERQVAVTEVFDQSRRWYSYYLYTSRQTLVGLDNSPDRAALRLKYGKDFSQHLYESIPHWHTDKQSLELTDEKTFDDFVKMVLEFREQP